MKTVDIILLYLVVFVIIYFLYQYATGFYGILPA